ncbi:hypothetical protein [Streptomyces sp. NPDC048172]|uniref:hypothetical protein n=1 Tax=Streptomyces sp. NPDC048172 TaxID=3365505 RepID=UPI0037105C03
MKHVLNSLYLRVQAGAEPQQNQPPKPGRSAPGELSKAVDTILSLASWLGTAAGVAGVIFVGAKMAVSMKQGQGSDDLPRLGMVMGGCILVATAGPVVTWFFNLNG